MKIRVEDVLALLLGMSVFVPCTSSALTVRAKSDLRLWETVTDRSQPLSWTWEGASDAAVLTFSNRLTRTVTSVTVPRAAGAMRGSCPHPVADTSGETLVVATLVQTAGGVEVEREKAELAYVPGAGGGAITVRSKAGREWNRVHQRRLAAYDASWWDVEGPSGYEVIWAKPCGPHRVVREFAGTGVVDETVLKFGRPGLLLSIR